MSVLIYKQISRVMSDVSAIGKNQKNAKQGYAYRGVDDCYNELNPIMAKYNIFTTSDVIEARFEERKSSSGNALFFVRLTIKFTFYAEDGSYVTSTTVGEGMDSGDKASNKAMAVAHKYALTQIFMVPTADKKDPETESHDVKPAPIKDKPKSDLPAMPEVATNKAEVYEEKDDQKTRFVDIAVKCGVDKQDKISLKEISASCKGTKFSEMEKKVFSYLQDPFGAPK